MSQARKLKRRKLGVVLASIFALTLIMGPGPGLYLVNPSPQDPDALSSICNVPVVYIWTAFWASVQAGVVVVAYFKLWDDGESGS
jgi:uncharacterized membrane protein